MNHFSSASVGKRNTIIYIIFIALAQNTCTDSHVLTRMTDVAVSVHRSCSQPNFMLLCQLRICLHWVEWVSGTAVEWSCECNLTKIFCVKFLSGVYTSIERRLEFSLQWKQVNFILKKEEKSLIINKFIVHQLISDLTFCRFCILEIFLKIKIF